LQANDKRRAYDLLGRAVQLEPHSEQAWLWLSGAVDSAAERRYCLERVLAINPHNAAALRGLAILPPALPVSPFPEDAPPEPSVIEPEPGQARAVGSGLATSAPLAQPASLLDIILQPDPPVAPAAASARREASEVADPTVVTYMPPPIAAASAPPRLAAGPDRHALADFVVHEFGRHRSHDEIVRSLSERHHLAWAEAQNLVAKIAHEQRRTIAARQSPFLIFLGIVTIIAGCYLVGRGILTLSQLYANPTLLRVLNVRV